MKKLAIIAAAISAALALSGCKKDDVPSSAAGLIRCQVSHTALTKAAEVGLDSLKKTGFTMLGIIDENAKDYTIGREYEAGTYIDNKTVSWSSDSWSIAGSPKWVLQDTMRFWCWTPTTGLTINPGSASLIGSRSLGISLTMPEGGQTDASSHASDAGSQHDILFCYNACKKTSSTDTDLNLYFWHALSNIRFCVVPSTNTTSTPTGEFRYDYSIVSIALQDVSRIADCTITGIASATAAAPTFTWDNQSGTTGYTQYYNASFKSDDAISCPSGWTSSTGSSSGKTICTADESFFVIPQVIGATTSLAVTLTNGSKTTTLSVPLKGEGTSEWLPGKYYTYGIAVSEDISDPAGFSVTLVDWDTNDYSVRF